MLEMKEKCETCETPLAADGVAYICTFECTFCEPCTENVHQGVCPNCGGKLVSRPVKKES
ncbi:MAG: DUF1272 domain-containing protein [Proteobacteria bacterium]|nr:DUF1272 domain-containing protein [Pseudomonadota bacterium]